MRPIRIHIEEIKNKGFKEFIRKFRRFFDEDKLIKSDLPLLFNLLICSFWAPIGVLIMRGLSPWILVRIGELWSSKIGHFCFDASEQFIRMQKRKDNTVDWFWFKEPSSNDQWAIMVKRELPIVQWAKYLDIWNRVLPGGHRHMLQSSKTGTRDIEGLFCKTNYKIKFQANESEFAKSWLRREGWEDGDPFICLLVRDSAYLSTSKLHAGSFGPGHTYHDYRDSCIETYIPAINWLGNQKVWVLRMGKYMHNPIDIDNQRVIDYAFHKEKNDLLDVWLFSNCNGIISTCSGPDNFGIIYNIPILYINSIPFHHFPLMANCIWSPKKLFWKHSGMELNIFEYIQNSYEQTHEYDRNGIKIRDLNSDEITEGFKEFFMKLNNGNYLSNEMIELQNSFTEMFKTQDEIKKLNNFVNKDSNLSIRWLKKYNKETLENRCIS